MALFGNKKEEEQGIEESDEIIQRLEALESHFNALDSAVQHHDTEIQEIVDTITADERNLKSAVEKNKRKLETIRDISSRFAEIQSENNKKIDVIDSEVSDLKRKLVKKNNKIKELREKHRKAAEDLEDLKEKTEDLETELMLDMNSQAYDIDSKVDESEFDSRSKRVDRELSKLRASINDIADKLGSDAVRTE